MLYSTHIYLIFSPWQYQVIITDESFCGIYWSALLTLPWQRTCKKRLDGKWGDDNLMLQKVMSTSLCLSPRDHVKSVTLDTC